MRAIAVLLVVAFHGSPNRVKAGFIGVDIFFVISGFLISRILVKAINDGNIDIAGFYQRRIKRIFPALLLVLAFALVLGSFVLYPEEFKQLGHHISGGAIFFSNIFLWRESGYFDNAPELKPLLHLWSLAIEEQFYIFFPLLLWACKGPRRRSAVLSIAFLGSLAYGIWLTAVDPNSAYLLPFSRFWELLAGALLAEHCPKPSDRPLHQNMANGASLLGAALIAVAVAVVSKASFPGAYALLPVLGTVMLIGAGPAALVNRHLLSSKLLVGVGLVSYPLYLWHGVLFSFARIVYTNHAPPLLIIALAGVSLVAAILTYKLLEVRVQAAKSTHVVFYLVLLMAVVGSCGYWVSTNSAQIHEGWGRVALKDGPIDHASFHEAFANQKNLCARQHPQADTCPDTKNFPEGRVAVFGDSHAEQFSLGLAMLKPKLNVTFYNALGLPVLGNAASDFSVQALAAAPDIDVVFMIALWDKRMDAADSAAIAQLQNTILALQQQGKKVFLVDTVPNFPFLPQQCKYPAPWLRESRCSVAADVAMGPRKLHAEMLRNVALKTSASFASLSNSLCDAKICRMDEENYVLYRDNNHVNAQGAKHVVQGFLRDSGL